MIMVRRFLAFPLKDLNFGLMTSLFVDLSKELKVYWNFWRTCLKFTKIISYLIENSFVNFFKIKNVLLDD